MAIIILDDKGGLLVFTQLGNVFTQASLWVWRIMHLNWAWILHTILGGVVLGLFPATLSMFYISKKWLKGGIDDGIWREFHRYYKENFWVANGLGWAYAFVGVFLVWDLYIVTQIQGFFPLLCMIAIIFALIFYVFAFFYLFSYYVCFKGSFKDYLFQPFIIGLLNLRGNTTIAIGIIMICYLIYQLPGLVLFTAGVMPSYWIMKVSLNNFKKWISEEECKKMEVL
ncbi:YesL family protein [Proteinivorax tanatarense]|uniref:YesL family protein n=1 Tax=Proteinivorax tanatarense TaxID=1260629 RepID=A0AAU7VJQ5_9FIRM